MSVFPTPDWGKIDMERRIKDLEERVKKLEASISKTWKKHNGLKEAISAHIAGEHYFFTED